MAEGWDAGVMRVEDEWVGVGFGGGIGWCDEGVSL